MYPGNFHYSKDHEWLKIDGDTAVIGITDFAQKQLGDVVYVELPAVGAELTVHQTVGVDRVRQGRLGYLLAGLREGR